MSGTIKAEWKRISIVSVVSFLILFLFYGKNILDPGKHLFVSTGDGLKSYFVYQYHIVNDSSNTQTGSINYPYGESHVFTDGQIFFADIFKCIHSFFPGIEAYSIEFLNELMIFSYVICIILLYLILRKLRLPFYFSALGAIAIGFLSPQVFRMVSHISLSYCFFIPLVWYLYIRFRESEHKWKYTMMIMLVLVSSPFVHGYYLLIGAMFLACLWMVSALQNLKNIKSVKKHWIHFLFQIMVPLITFQIYLHLFDEHIGRTKEPFGILYFTANLSTVFIPNSEPTVSLFRYFFSFDFQEWEGWAYVGLSMLFIVALTLIKIIRYLLKKRIRPVLNPALPAILRPAIWAAVLVLLYSFGYPYKAGMQFLLDWFPFLKQFRALGRFAWVFYYVFTVYGMYVFYLLIRKLRQKKWNILSIVLQVLFFSILFIEGSGYHQRATSLLSTAPNPFRFLELPDEMKEAIHAVDPGKYQALLPLPFYHVGSEAQTREWTDKLLYESMSFSYHTGMPMIASSCARTSQTEAANIFQLLSPCTFRKEAQKNFLTGKPVLIIYSKEQLQYDESDVLSRAIRIYSNNLVELYELPYDSLFKYCGEAEIIRFEKEQPMLQQKNGFWMSDTSQFFLSNNFDKFSSGKTFAGQGAFTGTMSAYNFLLPDTILDLDTSQYYEASFWYYNRGFLVNNVMAYVQEKTSDNKNATVIASQNLAGCSNISGEWSLVKIIFRLQSAGDKISISIKGNDGFSQPVYADELLVRPFSVNIMKALSYKNNAVTKLYVNNIILERN